MILRSKMTIPQRLDGCRLFLAAVAFCLSAWSLKACGISWKTPSAHFDGVNEQGYMMYSETVGNLEFGGGLKLPLIVNFRSNRQAMSPYGGYGWLIPLLESNVVQLEENRFRLVQPDGWNRYFGRVNATDTALLGDGGWAAELKGNTFTSWAHCGWKLVYINGKISSMTTPDNRKFDWVRNGDRVAEIREGGVTQLKVIWDDAGTEMAAIECNGERYAFEKSSKPRVQNVANQNVLTAIDRSLSRVVLPDGAAQQYEFGTDEKLNPTLKVNDRLLSWDPVTNLIVSDGDWKYQVSPAQDGGYAAIGRSRGKGAQEFWYNDRNKGIERTKRADGSETVTTVFPNGKLAGKLRKREVYLNGEKQSTFLRSYSENGQILRDSNQETSSGVSTMIEYVYDANGRLEWQIGPNDESTRYSYADSGRTVEKFKGNRVLWSKSLDSSGQVLAMFKPEFPGTNFIEFNVELQKVRSQSGQIISKASETTKK